MQKKLLTLSFLFFYQIIWAQNSMITPEILSTAGFSAETSAAQVEWTVGEIAINSLEGINYQLTEGFHQPSSIDIHGPVDFGPAPTAPSFAIFPNPTTSIINITKEKEGLIFVELYDVLGRRHRTFPLQLMYSEIDLTEYSSGTYFLRFFDENRNFLRSYKVVKVGG